MRSAFLMNSVDLCLAYLIRFHLFFRHFVWNHREFCIAIFVLILRKSCFNLAGTKRCTLTWLAMNFNPCTCSFLGIECINFVHTCYQSVHVTTRFNFMKFGEKQMRTDVQRILIVSSAVYLVRKIYAVIHSRSKKKFGEKIDTKFVQDFRALHLYICLKSPVWCIFTAGFGFEQPANRFDCSNMH